MEFRFPMLFLVGVVAFIFWGLDYWRIFSSNKLTSLSPERRKFLPFAIMRVALFIIGGIAWGYISYALMQPREARSYTPSSRKVNDIIFSVDVSRSMLADDIPPNRLEVAKKRLREFARLRPTDRIGVVLFSEKVFTLLPLSTDPDLLDKVISDIDIGYLGSGTNIGDGLGLAVARAVESETKNKVIILLSDGVHNVGSMSPMQAAEEAKKYGIKVYTIALGSDQDARIPVGKSLLGTQYQLIPGGSIDYETLKKISTLTGGRFYPAKDEKSLAHVLDDIQKLEKTEIKVENQVLYDEKYHSYLLMGIVLLAIAEVVRRLLLREVV